MRLVHTGSPVGLPTRQAHAIQMTRMCEAFADNGLETWLLTTHPSGTDRDTPVDELFKTYDLRPVFRIHRLACLNLPLLRHLSYAVVAWLHVMRHFNDEQTIIYSRERFVSYLLLLSGKRLRARHIFESHTYLGARNTKFIMSLFSKLDRLVTITPFIAREYADAGVPEDILLSVANGVDPARFNLVASRAQCRTRLDLPSARPIIGYVGNFRNTMGMEKGISALIEAQARLLALKDGNPPLLVCVGGPADCILEYERLAASLGIGREHIIFPGYVARDEVPHWLRACDVLTIPWPQNEWAAYQTSPIKLFEYMASGTPIVASDLPAIREILTPGVNAVLVEPGDAESLAAGIASLLGEPDKGMSLAAEARRTVSNFTWEKRAKRVIVDLPPGCPSI